MRGAQPQVRFRSSDPDQVHEFLATDASLDHLSPAVLSRIVSDIRAAGGQLDFCLIAPARAATCTVFHGPLYELQPIDIWRGQGLSRAGRAGVLTTDDRQRWLAALGDIIGDPFQSMATNGDGGCGLHGIWGRPNNQQKLELSCGQETGRTILHDLLPDNIAAVAELCGSAEPTEASVRSSGWNSRYPARAALAIESPRSLGAAFPRKPRST